MFVLLSVWSMQLKLETVCTKILKKKKNQMLSNSGKEDWSHFFFLTEYFSQVLAEALMRDRPPCHPVTHVTGHMKPQKMSLFKNVRSNTKGKPQTCTVSSWSQCTRDNSETISSELADIRDWNSVANDNNVQNYYMESTNNANHMVLSFGSSGDCFPRHIWFLGD